ncbi:hypothetical protein RhiirA5_125401 [Rhizophagus irregularis]|uniref:Uncharacterized protein n=1 Tax=Rhizophagus irregularis TaxID=588596 RepID=A0A2N0QCN0_9GLOM|nr:hypothetical protein RhiirA5_125401 [Rhizophagus irregularis]
MGKPPALENDGAVLNFISSGERYSPRNDQDLCKMLLSNNSFYSLRRHRSPSTNGPSRKCANSTVLAMIRILVLTCSLFFRVVLLT